MRTGLLITAAVTVVASTAAAANFDINSADGTLDDISSGESAIEDCTDGLRLDVLHSDDYDDDINDWYVTGVRVAGASAGLLESCLDLALSVAIDDGDTNLTELGPVVLNATSVTDGAIELPVPDDIAIPVRSATEVSAVVERNLDAIAALVPDLPFDVTTAEPVIEALRNGQNAGSTGIVVGISQRFVPGVSGTLRALSIERDPRTSYANGTMTLAVTEGSVPDFDNVLTSQQVTVAVGQLNVYELDAPIEVVAGRTYSFTLYGSGYPNSTAFGFYMGFAPPDGPGACWASNYTPLPTFVCDDDSTFFHQVWID